MTDWKTNDKGAAISGTTLRIDMVLLFFGYAGVLSGSLFCRVNGADLFRRFPCGREELEGK